MLPLLPILLVGGGIFAGVKAINKKPTREKVSGFLDKVENRYQRFFQQHLDPLFRTEHRGQQLAEFSNDYSPREVDINHRLGLSVVSTGLAILGAMVYPPWSLVSAAGLLYIMAPEYMKV